MRHRKRNRSRRNRNNNSKQMALVTASVAALALGAGGVALHGYTNIEKPDANYCYERPDQYKAAVFVDNSLTQLSPAQLRDYRTAFERAYESAPANAKILFFTTTSDTNGSLADPVFTVCKPASNLSEQAAIGAPEKTASYLKYQADEAADLYSKEVDKVLADVQDREKVAGDSPILSQVRAISFNNEFAGKTRSFTIISDGIENSEIARFGMVKGDMPPFAKFKERGDYDLRIKPRSFAGTDIKLLLVEHGRLPAPGLEYVSNDELRRFWTQYFQDNEAADVELTTLRYWVGAR